MTAAASDKFKQSSDGGIPVVATVQSPRSAGGSSLTVDTQQYWPTGTGVAFSTYKVDTANKKVDGTQVDYEGVSNGTNTISDIVRTGGGVDTGNDIGDKVQMGPTAKWGDDIAEGISVEHAQDGTHTDIHAISAHVTNDLDVGGDATISGTLTVDGKDVSQLLPAGVLSMYGGSSVPAGWLVCDGSSVLRATYPDLFTAIGTTYGAVDGTHFTLPNFKGKTPFGVDAAQTEFAALGASGGQKSVQAHSHGVTDPGHNHALWSIAQEANVYTLGGTSNRAILKGGSPNSGDGLTGDRGTGISIQSAGSGANNLNPYLTVNFIIKT